MLVLCIYFFLVFLFQEGNKFRFFSHKFRSFEESQMGEQPNMTSSFYFNLFFTLFQVVVQRVWMFFFKFIYKRSYGVILGSGVDPALNFCEFIFPAQMNFAFLWILFVILGIMGEGLRVLIFNYSIPSPIFFFDYCRSDLLRYFLVLLLFVLKGLFFTTDVALTLRKSINNTVRVIKNHFHWVIFKRAL